MKEKINKIKEDTLIKLSNELNYTTWTSTFRMTDEEETKAVILNAIEMSYRHLIPHKCITMKLLGEHLVNQT